MTTSHRWKITRLVPSFQFSLRSLLILTAVVAMCAGLAQWNGDLGGIAAILLLGGWWTGAAIGARRYRTAYLLGAFTAGLVWYALILIAFSVLRCLVYLPDVGFPGLRVAFCMCAASAAAATLLRPWVDADQSRWPVLLTLAMIYLTAFFFVCAAMASELLVPSQKSRTLVAELPALVLDAIVPAFAIVTAAFFLTVPAALLVLLWLRAIVAAVIDVGEVEERILEAIDTLRVLGPCFVTAEDIARKAGFSRRLTHEFLERLLKCGRLQWTREAGYCRD
jgi:hypothetical protein